MKPQISIALSALTLSLTPQALAQPTPEPNLAPEPVPDPEAAEAAPDPDPEPAPAPAPYSAPYPHAAPDPNPPLTTHHRFPLRDLPSTLPHYADEPIPDGYHLVEHPNWALTGTGIGVLGATWITSVIAAISLDRAPDGSDDPNFDDDYAPLFVPVVGPFAAIATADASGTGAGILALDGVVQLTGAVLILAGLIWPKSELEKKETLWTLMPTASSEGGGARLRGSF